MERPRRIGVPTRRAARHGRDYTRMRGASTIIGWTIMLSLLSVAGVSLATAGRTGSDHPGAAG